MAIDGTVVVIFLGGGAFFALAFAGWKAVAAAASLAHALQDGLALLRRIAESGPSDEQTVLAIKTQTEALGWKLDSLIEKASENTAEIGHIAAEQAKLQAIMFGGGVDGYVAYDEKNASRDAEALKYARDTGVSFEEAKRRLGENWLYKDMALGGE